MRGQNSTSGRVEQADTKILVNGVKPERSANDSHDQRDAGKKLGRAKRRYVTKAMVEALRGKLNTRQWSSLRDIGRLGVATGRQLERLHYDHSDSGRRLARLELSQLVDWQVLQRLTRRIGGVRSGSKGYVYALGLAGQRLLWPNRARYRQPWTPRPRYLRHALNVSDLYVRLREAETEQPIQLSIYDAEPRCWRSFAGPGGAPTTLKPDAYVELNVGDFEDRYFIEVDLASGDGPRILAKAKTFVRYWQSGKEQEESQVFPIVLWVTTTEERRSFIVDVLTKLAPDQWQVFAVTTIDKAAALMASGAATAISNQREEVNE